MQVLRVITFELRVANYFPVRAYLRRVNITERKAAHIVTVRQLHDFAEKFPQTFPGIEAYENESVPNVERDRPQTEAAAIEIEKLILLGHAD